MQDLDVFTPSAKSLRVEGVKLAEAEKGDFISVVVPLGAPWATRLVLEGRMCAQSAPKTPPWQPKRVPKSPQVAKNDAKRYTKIHKTIFKLILHSNKEQRTHCLNKGPAHCAKRLQ